MSTVIALLPALPLEQLTSCYGCCPKLRARRAPCSDKLDWAGYYLLLGRMKARLNRSLLYLWYYSTFPPGSAVGLPGVLFLHRQVFGVVDCIHLLNMV